MAKLYKFFVYNVSIFRIAAYFETNVQYVWNYWVHKINYIEIRRFEFHSGSSSILSLYSKKFFKYHLIEVYLMKVVFGCQKDYGTNCSIITRLCMCSRFLHFRDTMFLVAGWTTKGSLVSNFTINISSVKLLIRPT